MTWPWRAEARNKAFVVATKSASLDNPPPFTDSNINIMVFDQRRSLWPRHALIHLCLHTIIALLLRITCLKFARAEMPSSSTPRWRWREQERYDGHHHHIAGIASQLQAILAHSTRDSSPEGVSCRPRV
jgi:hypothetical protein